MSSVSRVFYTEQGDVIGDVLESYDQPLKCEGPGCDNDEKFEDRSLEMWFCSQACADKETALRVEDMEWERKANITSGGQS